MSTLWLFLIVSVCGLVTGALAGWFMASVLVALLHSEDDIPLEASDPPPPCPFGWDSVGPSDCDLVLYDVRTVYAPQSGTWYAVISRNGVDLWTTSALDRTEREALAYAEFIISSRSEVLSTLYQDYTPVSVR